MFWVFLHNRILTMLVVMSVFTALTMITKKAYVQVCQYVSVNLTFDCLARGFAVCNQSVTFIICPVLIVGFSLGQCNKP